MKIEDIEKELAYHNEFPPDCYDGEILRKLLPKMLAVVKAAKYLGDQYTDEGIERKRKHVQDLRFSGIPITEKIEHMISIDAVPRLIETLEALEKE